MDCGSKYVWINDALDDEELEIDESKNLFTESTTTTTTNTVNAAPVAPPLSDQLLKQAKKKIKFRRADTNVISVNFGTLIEQAQLSTGDAVFCRNCKAVLSSVSTLIQNKDNQLWVCEFCQTPNEVDVALEELPQTETVDYILNPPSLDKTSAAENTVVFCIDISGSMGVSYEIQGKVKLRGEEKIQKLSTLNTERAHNGAFADQYLPNENRDVTYVTRLQCVQAAIGGQIDIMHKENPNYRAAIVTFNNEVTLIGDGSQSSTTIAGDKLNNYDEVFAIGQKVETIKQIKETKDSLLQKLFGLEETGSTALGPALVASLGICSHTRGSKIVICTDGISNVGLGALDELHTDEEKDKAGAFYEQIGLYAKSQGITISVISIKGSDCSIENLGQLSELTSGTVERVDPLEITKNFQSILSLPVIATHVNATLLLHQGLFFRTEESRSNKDTKDIGNVTNETMITFEYGVRSDYKVEEFSKLKDLPFQLQIIYTKLDGMKCMRCISKKQEITFDQAKAEEKANIGVLGVNALQQTAKLAAKGDYMKARAYNYANKKLLSKAVQSDEQQQQYSVWASKGVEFESEMQQVQMQEKSDGMDMNEDDDSYLEEDKKKERQEERSKARRNRRNDATSNMLYKLKAFSKK